ERIARGSVHEGGIKHAEFAVRARITKCVDELVGGHLNLNRIRCRRREADFRPCVATKNCKSDKGKDRGGRPENFHRNISARETRPLAAIAEAKNSIRKPELGEDE